MQAKRNPYREAVFSVGANRADQLPPDEGREAAFAGRSNAGKSSALNAIADNRTLARTSKTPGRTQQINVFTLDEERRLVDLPGYGYAKVPEAVKRHWQQFLERYLRERRSLAGLILLVDIRHPMKEFDRQMLMWCHAARMPVHVLLTKADKLKRGPATATLQRVRRELAQEFPGASVQLFSALKRDGLDEARDVLNRWLAYDGEQKQSATE